MKKTPWLLSIVVAGAIVAGPSHAQTWTNGTSVPIPDTGYDTGLMACSTISVPSDGSDIVNGVTLTGVEIDHTWVGDLTVKLTSAAGTVITLVSRPGLAESADDGSGCCGDSANISSSAPISFDDGFATDAETMGGTLAGNDDVVCADDALCAYFPNPGAAIPGNLASLNGQSKVGDWVFCVGDSGGGDTGTLQSWTLNIDSIVPVDLQSFSIE